MKWKCDMVKVWESEHMKEQKYKTVKVWKAESVILLNSKRVRMWKCKSMKVWKNEKVNEWKRKIVKLFKFSSRAFSKVLSLGNNGKKMGKVKVTFAAFPQLARAACYQFWIKPPAGQQLPKTPILSFHFHLFTFTFMLTLTFYFKGHMYLLLISDKLPTGQLFLWNPHFLVSTFTCFFPLTFTFIFTLTFHLKYHL